MSSVRTYRGNRRRTIARAKKALLALDRDTAKYTTNPIVTVGQDDSYVVPLVSLLDAALLAGTTRNGSSAVAINGIANQTSTEGTSVSVVVYASAADGGVIAFSSEGLPSNLAIGPSTGIIGGTVDAGASTASPYAVVVTASDGSKSAATTFFWTVTP